MQKRFARLSFNLDLPLRIKKKNEILFWFKTGLDLVENINSKEAYDLLQKDEHAILIDVRTKKSIWLLEYLIYREIGKETYIIEWKNSILPGSRKRFLNDFNENLALDHEGKYIFICRSGIRSNFAALTVEESFDSGNYNGRCFNVEDGFEGHEQSLGYPQKPTDGRTWACPGSRVNLWKKMSGRR